MNPVTAAKPTAEGVVSHDNTVYLQGQGISNVTPNGTVEVTEGQPSSPPPTATQNSGGWQVDLNCGRQGNAGVASDFVNACGGSGNNMYGLDATIDSTPQNLNFYFGINFTYTGQSQSVTLFLAQGHTGFENNWWIGGSAINNNNGTVTLSLPDGSELTVSEGDDNTFIFSQS